MSERVLTDEELLAFIMSPNEYYSEERTLLGKVKVRLRILSTTEIQECDEAADKQKSFGSSSVERMKQWIARSLISVGNEEVVKPLDEKIKWLGEWPWPLLTEAVNGYLEIMQTYQGMCNPERLKNSQGVPDSNGESSPV